MKKCPDCSNELVGVDTIGLFSFEKSISKIFWLISVIFLALLWSILIPKLIPEEVKHIALGVYYSLVAILIYKLYKSNNNKVIYECISCKQKFKGNALTKFNYGEPETKI
jgi:hypothetical protein